MRPLLAAFSQLDTGQLEAASSLGARTSRIVRQIILPEALPALAAGGSLVLVLCLNEFGIVLFTGAKGVTTLPTLVVQQGDAGVRLPGRLRGRRRQRPDLRGPLRPLPGGEPPCWCITAGRVGRGTVFLLLFLPPVRPPAARGPRRLPSPPTGPASCPPASPPPTTRRPPAARPSRRSPPAWSPRSPPACSALATGTWAALAAAALKKRHLQGGRRPVRAAGRRALRRRRPRDTRRLLQPPMLLNGTRWIVIIAHPSWSPPSRTSRCRRRSPASTRRTEQAAASLGASPARVLWRVRLPLLLPSLTAAAGLCFALSMGELSATMMLYPPDWTPLPVLIYASTDRCPVHQLRHRRGPDDGDPAGAARGLPDPHQSLIPLGGVVWILPGPSGVWHAHLRRCRRLPGLRPVALLRLAAARTRPRSAPLQGAVTEAT